MMEFVNNNGGASPLVSIILLDWGVRESFHAVHYLNRQNFDRDKYEIIWVEFYDHRPKPLADAQRKRDRRRDFYVDKWIVLGYPEKVYYHKHLMYNVGIVAAGGGICAICDSDAIYPPTFVRSIHNALRISKDLVVHVDQVRSENRKFYPFNYPDIPAILEADGLVNWTGSTTTGLAGCGDFIHDVNYGACMAARRKDIIGIGGADEHIHYLGYICGPYDMTWRLVNAGKHEQWLTHEFCYHTWHPGQAGHRNFGGPHDGRNVSTLALEARVDKRAMPFVENQAIFQLRQGTNKSAVVLLNELMMLDRSDWENPEQHLQIQTPVQLAESDYRGCNIVFYKDRYYGIPQEWGEFSRPKADDGGYAEVAGSSVEQVKHQIDLRVAEAEQREAALQETSDPSAVAVEPAPLELQEPPQTEQEPAATALAHPADEEPAAIGEPVESVPLLVVQGYRGFNVVRYDGQHFAICAYEGSFDPDRIVNRDYSICYWGFSRRQVLARLRREPATRIGRWALRPGKGGLLRRVARGLLDPLGVHDLLRRLGQREAAAAINMSRAARQHEQLLCRQQRLKTDLTAQRRMLEHLTENLAEHRDLLEKIRHEVARRQERLIDETRARVRQQEKSMGGFKQAVAKLSGSLGEMAAIVAAGKTGRVGKAQPSHKSAKEAYARAKREADLAHISVQEQAIASLLGEDAPSDEDHLSHEQLLERIGQLDFSQNLPLENTFLYFCASKVPAGGTIVDLGTGHGGSAFVFWRAVRGRDVRIVSVDHRSYPQAQERLADTPVELIEAGTIEFSKRWADRDDCRIDLLFIDAGHALADVYNDYHAWIPFVRRGGIVIFHDYDFEFDGGTNHLGVRVFLDALRRIRGLAKTYHDKRCLVGVKPGGKDRVVSLADCKDAFKRIGANVCRILDGKARVIKAWPQTAQRLVSLLEPRYSARICTPPNGADPYVVVGDDEKAAEKIAAGATPKAKAHADMLSLLYMVEELISSADEPTAMRIASNRNAMLHWREGVSMLAEAMGSGGFPRRLDAVDAAADIEALSRCAALEQSKLLMLMEVEQPGVYL